MREELLRKRVFEELGCFPGREKAREEGEQKMKKSEAMGIEGERKKKRRKKTRPRPLLPLSLSLHFPSSNLPLGARQGHHPRHRPLHGGEEPQPLRVR